MFTDSFDALKWLIEQLTNKFARRAERDAKKAEQVATFLDTTATAIEEAAAAFKKDELPWAAYGRLEEIALNFRRVLSQVIGKSTREDTLAPYDYEGALADALGIILDWDAQRSAEEGRRYMKLRHEWKTKDDVVQARLQRVAGRFRGLADTIRARHQVA